MATHGFHLEELQETADAPVRDLEDNSSLACGSFWAWQMISSTLNATPVQVHSLNHIYSQMHGTGSLLSKAACNVRALTV